MKLKVGTRLEYKRVKGNHDGKFFSHICEEFEIIDIFNAIGYIFYTIKSIDFPQQMTFSTSHEERHYHIWKYFYKPDESRQKKLKTIL